MGFQIKNISSSACIQEGRLKSRTRDISSHNERCDICKTLFHRMLQRTYGRALDGQTFKEGTRPEDYLNTRYYQTLKEIFEALQIYRGFREFVKIKTLPRVDFFMPHQRFILEFDESQHFTIPRKITLEHYPESLMLGFNKRKWIRICETIGRKSKKPPYRDEQRAWYDTLRDFLPSVREGLKPTVRVYSKEREWCSFDPNSTFDSARFRKLIEGNFEMGR